MYVPHIHRRKLLSKELVEELKVEINKTEYEKAREPLQKELIRLNQKIREQQQEIKILYEGALNLIKSVERDFIKVIVMKEESKARFYNDSFIPDYSNAWEVIKIPIKEDLIEDYCNKLNDIQKKYKYMGIK